MEKSGRRHNKRQQPLTRYTNEDIIPNPCGVSTSQRATVLKGPCRFRRCGIGQCKPCTCLPSTQSPKQRLTPTHTDFERPVQQQRPLKPVSLHCVETTEQNGYSKAIFVPASTKSRMNGW